MEIKTFGVIGAGQMGSGIAQVAAASGLRVILNDIREDLVDKGIAAIAARLDRAVGKGAMAAGDRDAQFGRIRKSMSVEDMIEADFVVEAATENEPLKFKIFRDLDRNSRPGVILASNTSSIPIGRIASQTRRPDRVIGMHFMNPVPVMKLVEVVRALATSDETFRTTWDLCLRFGKTPAEAVDYPGFISNRIVMPMINEAVYCLYEGAGSCEAIDTVMKLGMNHPMGPLALADLIGLDTCLAIMETLFEGFKDSKYRPCPLLRRYVEAGRLGRKVGRGFYEYGSR
ncbi:MAG: putative 3-hydroxybutyryl-CoA dehydrogenase [Syntrophaceae bacterium PtaU1.Bin231]|nr:MAG: putative 3-hydroxybutyryl-CoA dehydrogenase [Syntrophaceae bacterium PtaU1.Bin231]HOG16853.1 3-hydroxybutyryl-CoA dehydrogenase [Syntrophales bacterium]